MNDKERAEIFLNELIQTKRERGIEYSRDHNKTPRQQIEEIWKDEVKKKNARIHSLLSCVISNIANGGCTSFALVTVNEAKRLMDEVEVDETMREVIRHDILERDIDEVEEDKEEITEDDWKSFEKIIKMLSDEYLYGKKHKLHEKGYDILNRHSFDYLMRGPNDEILKAGEAGTLVIEKDRWNAIMRGSKNTICEKHGFIKWNGYDTALHTITYNCPGCEMENDGNYSTRSISKYAENE